MIDHGVILRLHRIFHLVRVQDAAENRGLTAKELEMVLDLSFVCFPASVSV